MAPLGSRRSNRSNSLELVAPLNRLFRCLGKESGAIYERVLMQELSFLVQVIDEGAKNSVTSPDLRSGSDGIFFRKLPFQFLPLLLCNEKY